MRRKRAIRAVGYLIAAVLLLMNTVAAFHAYRFTHFDASGSKTKEIGLLSPGEKVWVALTGINNPKPVNFTVPGGLYETIRLKSNKVIECWYMGTERPKGTVVLCHGYMGEKASMLEKAEIFRQLGYNTLLVDFMGSGGSEGNQTTIGFSEAEEVKSCVDYLRERGERNIVLMGTSMGAVAIMKALHDYAMPVSHAILECPFGTMVQTVENRFRSMGLPTFPMAYLLVFWGGVENGFDALKHNPIGYAGRIKCPTLLLYGAKDDRVTVGEIDAIYAKLGGEKREIIFPMAGHNDYLKAYRNEWTTGVKELLAK